MAGIEGKKWVQVFISEDFLDNQSRPVMKMVTEMALDQEHVEEVLALARKLWLDEIGPAAGPMGKEDRNAG